MRLFLAVDPPAAAISDLAAAVDSVRSEHPTLRWAVPQLWHLTLAFLGEVEEARVPDLSARIARACARHPRHDLALAGAGRFDGRVLWAGVTGDTEVTSRLAASLAAAARRCHIDVEDRRYRPHLTLARSRQPIDLRPAVAALASYAGPSWTAGQVHLVRSTLGPHPRHDDLGTWPLA